jgi:hypothetical protein
MARRCTTATTGVIIVITGAITATTLQRIIRRSEAGRRRPHPISGIIVPQAG